MSQLKFSFVEMEPEETPTFPGMFRIKQSDTKYYFPTRNSKGVRITCSHVINTSLMYDDFKPDTFEQVYGTFYMTFKP